MNTEEPKKEKKMPAQVIDINIGGNVYPIKFPNVGQLIDIENNKARTIDAAIDTSFLSGVLARTMAEAISVFTVLIPTLKEKLNVPLAEMDLLTANGIAKEYREKYLPWQNQWMAVLYDMDVK